MHKGVHLRNTGSHGLQGRKREPSTIPGWRAARFPPLTDFIRNLLLCPKQRNVSLYTSLRRRRGGKGRGFHIIPGNQGTSKTPERTNRQSAIPKHPVRTEDRRDHTSHPNHQRNADQQHRHRGDRTIRHKDSPHRTGKNPSGAYR